MHTMHQLLCTKRAVRGKVIYNKVMDRSWLNNNLGGTRGCPEYQVGKEGERGKERGEERFIVCVCNRGEHRKLASLDQPRWRSLPGGRAIY